MFRLTLKFTLALALFAMLAAATVVSTLTAAPRGDRPALGEMRDGPSRDGLNPEQRQQQRFERMCDYLELNQTQREQAQELFRTRRDEMLAHRQELRDSGLDRQQAQEKMRQNFEQHRQEFEALLNAQQLEKLATWEQQRKPRGERAGRPRPDVGERLGLTDSQQEQLETLTSTHRKNLQDIRQRIKDEDIAREQARELIKAENERFVESLSGVLSQDQIEQLGRMRGKRGPGGPLGHLMRGIGPRLELTDQQLAAVRELAAPYHEQIGGILKQAREQELERGQVHGQVKPLIDQFIAELAGVLDSEQKATLDDFLARMKERRSRVAIQNTEGSETAGAESEADLAAGVELPRGFALDQNSPNPFNPSTTITYSIPEGEGMLPVELTIYDMRGREVIRLVETTSVAGSYSVVWDGLDSSGEKVPSGVYLYRLKAGVYEQNRKMVMLK